MVWPSPSGTSVVVGMRGVIGPVLSASWASAESGSSTGEFTRQDAVDARASSRHTAGMTTTQKIAVSLPKHVADSARRAVRSGRAKSVSAYVSDALEEKVKLDELSLLLDEMLAESGGPMTAAERRAADRSLGVSKTAPRRRQAK